MWATGGRDGWRSFYWQRGYPWNPCRLLPFAAAFCLKINMRSPHPAPRHWGGLGKRFAIELVWGYPKLHRVNATPAWASLWGSSSKEQNLGKIVMFNSGFLQKSHEKLFPFLSNYSSTLYYIIQETVCGGSGGSDSPPTEVLRSASSHVVPKWRVETAGFWGKVLFLKLQPQQSITWRTWWNSGFGNFTFLKALCNYYPAGPG